MVRNLVFRRQMSPAIKRYFRHIPDDIPVTSQNEIFEYGYPHSNALLQFCLKVEC